MAFKANSDTNNRLADWNSTSNPCGFSGVSCIRNRVSRLVLEDLNLQGSFEPLSALTQLRVLSLKRNRLSGPIPDLSNVTTLKLLFLSYNHFSGGFPASVTSLFRLYRLDLSFNNFTGEIPANVNRLIHLLTLRLENNQFSGSISRLNLPSLQDFNVFGNHFSGKILLLLAELRCQKSETGKGARRFWRARRSCTRRARTQPSPGSRGVKWCSSRE